MKREDFSAQKHTNMHASRNDLSESRDSFGSGFIFILCLLFFLFVCFLIDTTSHDCLKSGSAFFFLFFFHQM